MNHPTLYIAICVIVILLSIYAGLHIYTRHYEVGDKLYEAKFIELPGYDTVYYPEQKVSLQNWVGTKYSGFTANDTNGENTEATAGLALKVAGIYGDDYSLIKDGEHYILYRPEKRARYFTMQAFYRIWVGKLSSLNN